MRRALLDENIGQSIATALLEAGWDVTLASSIAPGTPDEDVLAASLRESRVLITRDRDYGDLIFRQGRPGFGVLYIRQRVDEQVGAEIVRLMAGTEGRFVTVDGSGVRVRPLPERLP